MNSARFKLNRADGLKILKGLGIALGGALLVYGAEVLPQIEFGVWQGVAVALGSALINVARKWLANNS